MTVAIEDKVKAFWVKWLEGDELEQVKLIESLTLPSNAIKDKKLHNYHVASMFSRYLEDFAKVLAAMSLEELMQYLAPYKEE